MNNLLYVGVCAFEFTQSLSAYPNSGSLCGMTFNLSGNIVWFQDELVL